MASTGTSASSRSEDPAWTRLAEAAAAALRGLDKSAAAVRRADDRMKGYRDVAKAKERVHAAAVEAQRRVVDVQQTLGKLEQYVRLHHSYGALVGRIAEGARESIQRFEEQHGAFLTRATTLEHEYRLAAEQQEERRRGLRRASGRGTRLAAMEEGEMEERGGDEAEDEGEQERAGLVAGDAVREAELLDRELHDEIMEERARECQAIATSVADINDIFRNLNEIVGQDGLKLELIETNVQSAEGRTRQAVDELRKARESVDRERQRNFCFLMAAALIVIAIVAVFSAK